MEEENKKIKLKQKLKYKKKISANSLLEGRMSRLSDASSTISSELSEEEADISNMLEEEKEKNKIFEKNFYRLLSKDLKALGDDFENNIIDTSIDKEAEESIKKRNVINNSSCKNN